MEVIFTSAGQQAQEFEQTVAPRDMMCEDLAPQQPATCHCLRVCLDTLHYLLQARRSHILLGSTSTIPHVQRTTTSAKLVYVSMFVVHVGWLI